MSERADCPECGSADIAIEKCPNGDTFCRSCGYRCKSADWPEKVELPDTPDALTPEQAREAPDGPETDRLCLRVMGRDPDDLLMPSHGQVLFKGHWISRDPRGAHRARQWMRAQGYEVSLHDDAACATLPYIEGEQEHREWAVIDEGADEHTLSARLLLLLAAEGVIETGGRDE